MLKNGPPQHIPGIEGDTVFCHSMEGLARNPVAECHGGVGSFRESVAWYAVSRPVGLWTDCAFERADVSE